jgi:hypothetical protein
MLYLPRFVPVSHVFPRPSLDRPTVMMRNRRSLPFPDIPNLQRAIRKDFGAAQNVDVVRNLQKR